MKKISSIRKYVLVRFKIKALLALILIPLTAVILLAQVNGAYENASSLENYGGVLPYRMYYFLSQIFFDGETLGALSVLPNLAWPIFFAYIFEKAKRKIPFVLSLVLGIIYLICVITLIFY